MTSQALPKHYANPANCIDREPPVDMNWKPKHAVLVLTDPEPPVSTDHIPGLQLEGMGPLDENYVQPKGMLVLESMGEYSGIGFDHILDLERLFDAEQG